jgi:hypothetical protein
MYSVQGQKHLTDAVIFACAGCIGLFGCHRLWRANGSWKWVLVPAAVMIFAVVFPNIERWPHGTPVGRASFSALQRLSAFAGSATQLAREQGEFVCDRSATLSASSLFARQGQALPYVIHCVSDATGPTLGTPPERPGTLVFAVSQDRTRAWFTATVLAQRRSVDSQHRPAGILVDATRPAFRHCRTVTIQILAYVCGWFAFVEPKSRCSALRSGEGCRRNTGESDVRTAAEAEASAPLRIERLVRLGRSCTNRRHTGRYPLRLRTHGTLRT